MTAPLIRTRWAVMDWSRKQSCGGVSGKAVLMAMAEHADEDGVCWPSLDLLAAITEQSVDTVVRRIRDLEVLGLVVVLARHDERGRRSANEYRLQLDQRVDRVTAELRLADRRRRAPAAESADGAESAAPTPADCGGTPTPADCGGDPRTGAGAIEHSSELFPPLPPPHPAEPSPAADRATATVGLPGVDAFVRSWPWPIGDTVRVERVWRALTDHERRQVLAAVPGLAAMAPTRPPPAARWLSARGWASVRLDAEMPPAAACVVDASSAAGVAWTAFGRLVSGVVRGPVRGADGVLRLRVPLPEPPCLGLALGAVPPDRWVLVEVGTHAHAAWRERLGEAIEALGEGRMPAGRAMIGRLPDGRVARATGLVVPTEWPPRRHPPPPDAVATGPPRGDAQRAADELAETG